ncbi:MAG TPA: hypothetical protein VFU06_16530 [Longimicrobiales bacterium]|nr:hypothetical protein [Longimicrobiales bacterium]
MTTGIMAAEGRTGAGLRTGVGLAGRVALTFAIAGGVLLGGVYMAVMTLLGQMRGHAVLLTAVPLYVVGVVLGFVHGGMLGVLGRGDVAREEALRGVALAALYAIPLATIAFLPTGWIAMTQVALYLGRVGALAGSGAGWAIGAVLVAVAARYGWQAMQNALVRWPERRTGGVLIGAAFVALVTLLLVDAPAFFGLRVRTTALGAVLGGGLLAVWLVTPLVVVALRTLRGLPAPRPLVGPEENPRVFGDLAVGLVAGVALGLIAAPFAAAPIAAPIAAEFGLTMVLVAAGRALVDEVLLRLGVVTLVAWMLLRRRFTRTEAAVLAVVAAAAVQVVLYLPAVIGVGFPGFAGLAYLMLAVVVPALVFGTLYWKRGLGAALVANAAAVAVLAAVVAI